MPAAALSIAQLMDFESAFETAAQANLAISGINAFIEGFTTKLPLIKTNVWFDTGPALDQLTILPIGGQSPNRFEQEFFRYTGTLTLEVTSNRDTAQQPTDLGVVTTFQAQLRGRVRAAFMQSQWPFQDGNLPFYRVSEIRPAGTTTGFDPARNLDTVRLAFVVTFAIQPTAWPAGFPPS
jgi:hypothetical protein